NPTPKPKPEPTPRPPHLVVAKSAGRQTLRAGETVAFTITVTNRGPGTATNLKVCDALPDGLVFVDAGGARFVGGDACWRIPTLGPRETRHKTVEGKATSVTPPVVLAHL